jgi:translation initiation factor 1
VGNTEDTVDADFHRYFFYIFKINPRRSAQICVNQRSKEESTAMAKGHIVYSTDPDWKETCPLCDLPIDACICEKNEGAEKSSAAVKIRKEKKGRGGKTVTIISGLPGDLRKMQKELQRLCGAGGTVKEKIVEIQGDQVDKIRDYLFGKGMKVKG